MSTLHPTLHRRRPLYPGVLALLTIFTLAACGETKDGDEFPAISYPAGPQNAPRVGQTDFVSADGYNGQRTQDNDDGNNVGRGNDDFAAAPEAGADADAEPRTVEEGDIYRMMSGANMLLNLNNYRGLQIIDLADVTNPEIVGRVAISGSPVEMYQVADRVYILMNNWYGYYGSRAHDTVSNYHGGVVVAVDISDRKNPTIVARAQVPGFIRTSRLTRGGDKEALYVVANNGSETYVKSFSVSGAGQLDERTELSLGGYVNDIQATADRLLVARTDYTSNRNYYVSQVSVIDISSADGTMVEGQSVATKGRVQNQFNMDMHNNILRVVSTGNWNSTRTNHVETFNASNIHDIKPIDSATFGANEDLYATLFLEDSAFFVTYFRQDPFHAFSIGADGKVEEKSEFIVSGWNDFFRPVAQQSRLIGIGKNDENGRNTMAVSLYDITDLSNPHPLIDRKEIELDHSWSEAQWDHRAFSVLEKAVRIESADGQLETGLVLLPFTGYANSRYISAVQIFTFSETTLTLRGTMEHGTPVRRSFVANRAENTTANLSEAELTLFDITNPDSPVEKSRLELAPNFTNVYAFGDYAVRRQSRSQYYGWWGSRSNDGRLDTLEIVRIGDDIDSAKPIAQIEIPSHSQVIRAGNHLVVVETRYKNDSNGKQTTTNHLQIWKLSNPAAPILEGTLETDAIHSAYNYNYDYYGFGDGDYYGYGNPNLSTVALNNALVFVSTIQERELQGQTLHESTYPAQRYNANCYDNQGNPKVCSYLTGSIRCKTLQRVDGTSGPKTCTGAIRKCTQDAEGQRTCVEIDPKTITTESYSYTYDTYRYWTRNEFHPLDLRTAGAPKMAATITMATGEEAVATLFEGNKLFFAYKQPQTVAGDSRPFVRYFFKSLDLSDPNNPRIGDAVNVPGELIAVRGDSLLTRDLLWGSSIIETSINRLTMVNGRARLDAVQRFVDQQVQSVNLDAVGHVLVSHRLAWNSYYDDYDYFYGPSQPERDSGQKLSVIDARNAGFRLMSETRVDDWASLRAVETGRALFSVPGGLLVMNLDNLAAPFAQAYFATQGWPQDVVVNGDDIYFAAGRHGLYTFDINTFNLVLP
ncbi:MAG: beta-propeller domain-containing protein [Bradymonadaceae bacterium]|nr:beta-propeller domain-containing protein [Lujinxingiaceae bacterium]